jgi:cyclopropane fatty-acyl-phospholipid synthase-like methyltransferase
MSEQYISDEEYKNYYEKLNNLRSRIVRDLPIKSDSRILDIATGYAYFAIEVAHLNSNLKIVGIDISENCVKTAKKNITNAGLSKQIDIQQMDATNMIFKNKEFDMAVNFTGFEDIHMTRGKKGVEKTFSEVSRVLKPASFFCFALMLPDETETTAQDLELDLYSYICDATWLSGKEYIKIAEEHGFKLINRKSYFTGKKLTPNQAKIEIKYAVENVPKIYGITTPSFDEIWSKFGKSIEKHGLSHYSKVVSMVTEKISK